ncbi:MAG: hypothetical protein JRD89_15300 [Deltaproteobacteria bacterium]|nr:hypothetical protein [Deltaproteobacteria bacterium]
MTRWVSYIVYTEPERFEEVFGRLRYELYPTRKKRFNFNFYPAPAGDAPHISLRLERPDPLLEMRLDTLKEKGLVKKWRTIPYDASREIKTAYELGSRAALLIREMLKSYQGRRSRRFWLHLVHGFMDSLGFFRHHDEAEVYLDILREMVSGAFRRHAERAEAEARARLEGRR